LPFFSFAQPFRAAANLSARVCVGLDVGGGVGVGSVPSDGGAGESGVTVNVVGARVVTGGTYGSTVIGPRPSEKVCAETAREFDA
jgi:hypothetical protein